LLLAASLVNTTFGKSNLYTGWTQKFDNEPYEDLTAQVGDTITFIWPIEQIQNIFIHPTNDCTQTGRIPVGNQSPTEYTFKPEDGAPGGKSIFFANDVGDMCENYGMRLTVIVYPADDDDSGGDSDVDLTPIPTLSPTAAPTATPTMRPTPVPPTWPPIIPTFAPTFPTPLPTPRPTGLPTALPTPVPTPGPTIKATTADPTADPTAKPTGAPVSELVLTVSPTDSTENGVTRTALRGLQMTLTGIDSFPDESKQVWSAEIEQHCTSFYENDISGSSFQTSISVTNFFVTSNSKRYMRGLQNSAVIVTYNQVVSYSNTGNADITDDYLAKAPFASSEEIDSFKDILQNSNNVVLEGVVDVSAVTFADELVPIGPPSPTEPPKDKDEKDGEGFKLSLPAIIGIACGAGALVIIAILFWIYCRSSDTKKLDDENTPPPNVSIKPDDVSTLAPPETNGGNFGDRSLGTVDYDYSKAYQDKDHSISFAGGTLGSDTQDFSFPANAGATGAALGPYDDDYGKGKFKDEILHIFAPPGKLGVVIDTPDDGAPIVHAVKETSVVVDKVKVGDKLVAVDDEDVRTLTAIKVSKLISRKSANPSRKLTVLRRTQIG